MSILPQSVLYMSGVPRGSAFGPFLSLFYLNDLCLSPFSSNSSLVLYVDDSILCKSLSHSSDLSDFQAGIKTINRWFLKNLLSANASITKATLISIKENPFPDLKLYLDNQVIERVSSEKFFPGLLTSTKKKKKKKNYCLHILYGSVTW